MRQAPPRPEETLQEEEPGFSEYPYPYPPEEGSSNSTFSPIFEDDELDLDLTDEEKLYLKLKWGRTYQNSELV